MVTLKTPHLTYRDAREVPFLEAMADAPGEGTHLLVFADWLEEHERPALAAAVRERTPKFVRAHRRAAEALDALLAVDLSRANPFPMPRPDRGQHRSRKQWRAIVRAALKPFAVAHLTVAAAPGWREGPAVEIRFPGADFGIGDGRGDGFLVPWSPCSQHMLAAGLLVLAAIMPRLFPNEPARVVPDDPGEFRSHFWRAAVRLQPNP